MGERSKIQWTEATWNPVRGCSRVSQGCVNCYAERQAARFARPSDGYDIENGPFYGFVQIANGHPQWTGKVELVQRHLRDPLHWKQPRRIFVNSMSDLFHEKLTINEVASVFAVMLEADWHTYQILTKRADRMPAVLAAIKGRMELAWGALCSERGVDAPLPWPLPNVWLGVSAEDQKTADERIPLLLQTPAAIRFVSYEPALGPVDFLNYTTYPLAAIEEPGHYVLDWIIIGGESGPGARPFNLAWARSAIERCKFTSTACFVKQLGAKPFNFAFPNVPDSDVAPLLDRKGGNWDEWPADLRVREYPTI